MRERHFQPLFFFFLAQAAECNFSRVKNAHRRVLEGWKKKKRENIPVCVPHPALSPRHTVALCIAGWWGVFPLLLLPFPLLFILLPRVPPKLGMNFNGKLHPEEERARGSMRRTGALTRLVVLEGEVRIKPEFSEEQSCPVPVAEPGTLDHLQRVVCVPEGVAMEVPHAHHAHMSGTLWGTDSRDGAGDLGCDWRKQRMMSRLATRLADVVILRIWSR